jgi:hypothetical protein
MQINDGELKLIIFQKVTAGETLDDDKVPQRGDACCPQLKPYFQMQRYLDCKRKMEAQL